MGTQQNNSSSKSIIRLLLVMLLLFLSLLILLIVLQLTESALNVWQMLDQLSPGLLVLYGIGLLLFSVGIVALSWRVMRRGKKRTETKKRTIQIPEDRAAFDEALKKADLLGIDTALAHKELQELDQRTRQAVHFIAFFGPVSAGKSTLIRAVTGNASIQVDPRAGTTRTIEHYQFYDEQGNELILTDAPGILDTNEEHVRLAREEARRAHLVVYVSEGELTRDEYHELIELQTFGRPMMLALNKQDRYNDQELNAIRQRIGEQFPGLEMVPVQAGGSEEVILIDTQGEQKRVVRQRPAQVTDLVRAIQRRVLDDAEILEQQRDESLIRLGAEKLQVATSTHRQEQSEKLIKQYTRKAMLGAMAAVSPGTDVLIQGYLGVLMVRSLSELYDVRVRDVDLEQLVELASQSVGKRITLLLALIGNVLKAFPGIGTVTGGLTHAVAYGMIFEALGKSIVKTLNQGEILETPRILDNFEEMLSGNLEGRAKYFARLAVEQVTGKS
ncbi:MAG: 50S ribosome-binding GTPase [Candidatus Thiodiazotropha sp.]|jgi:uncharacterized protein